jgi:hypothetical protein
VTGCGCLALIAFLIAMLVIFVRGSFDSGEPVEQAVALAVALLLLEGWRRKWSADLLVRARGA